MKNFEQLQKLYKSFHDVNKHWGNLMPMMAMEEAGEFIQAISKIERYRATEDYNPCDDILDEMNRSALMKEAADIYIAIGALGYRYGFSWDDIERLVDKKLEKKY